MRARIVLFCAEPGSNGGVAEPLGVSRPTVYRRWPDTRSVLAALLTTWGLHRAAFPTWWLLPAVSIGATAVSLRRATKGRPPTPPS